MAKQQNQSFLLSSPASILIAVALSVFLSEALVMLLLQFLPRQNVLVEAIIDAALLVLLISPTLYFFLFRPLVTHISERQQIEEVLLKNKEEQIMTMIRASLDGFWILDLHGRFLEVNNAYCQLIEYSQAELLNMSLSDVNVSEDPQNISEHINKILTVGSDRFEIRQCRKDGRMLDLVVSANYNELNGGVIYCFLRDITEQNLVEDTLLENEEKFRSMSTYTNDAMIMMDNDGHISFWNKAAEKIFGYTDHEVMGKELHTFIAPEKYYDAFKKAYGQFRETGKGQMVGNTREITALRKGGVEFPIEIALAAIQLKGKWHSVGVVRDITERKRSEEKMQYQAHYDALTGLPNRELLKDRLQQAIATAKRNKTRVALMFLDLDKFKPVNDNLGHDVGDMLLKEVAVRMRGCMRESDSVARIGGDEFVILLPNVEAEQFALNVAEKVLYSLNQTFELSGHRINISASIGVAIYPEHGTDEKWLIKNADTAMYHAKGIGRNNVMLFKPDMITG